MKSNWMTRIRCLIREVNSGLSHATSLVMRMKCTNGSRLLTMLSLAVACLACSDDTPAPTVQQPEATEFGDVSGVITDAGTGNPIPGAIVTLLNQRVEADVEGRYVFASIRFSDTLNLFVEVAYYESRTRTIALNAENLTLDVSLKRLFGAVSGTITDTRTGNPIPGVTVTLLDRTVATDSDGRYNFIQIPYSEDLNLTVKDADYEGKTQTFTLNVERLVLKISLKPLTNPEAEIGEFFNDFSALIESTDVNNIEAIQNQFSETYQAADDPITRFGVASGSIPADFNHVIPIVTELFEKYSALEFQFHDIQVDVAHAREVSARLILDVLSQKEPRLDVRRLTAECQMDFSKEESGWKIVFWQLSHVDVQL